MGQRRVISELADKDEFAITRYLKTRGYEIEDVNPNQSDIDKGFYASIFLINDKKILRLVNEDTGFSSVPMSFDEELDKYKRVLGDDNDHIVKVYFSEYLESVDTYIYVLEKLNSVWKDLDYEFTEWYDYIFSGKHVHNKIEFVPNEKQIDLIFQRLYHDEYHERFRSFSNLDDQEQRIIKHSFKGIREMNDKYNFTMNDLHIANIMEAENGDYKIIDFGT